ncbi:hypothetical protein BO78DRAFT_116632 [Aspergillus sclerotiicarbonarius CBS 121057]|uniref:Uncharacterized protein n=1 Tax=Aspergillus sclerotiicarbonarius (strain CBS 121057 / IBT 28362) TaxID=1448318 RepID=A0A319EIC3_ASPSB|nr:hypothetical protein BO78DRAFT_116632 [Aspergillus sclerotiicarbonarius CBS 121057]
MLLSTTTFVTHHTVGSGSAGAAQLSDELRQNLVRSKDSNLTMTYVNTGSITAISMIFPLLVIVSFAIRTNLYGMLTAGLDVKILCMVVWFDLTFSSLPCLRALGHPITGVLSEELNSRFVLFSIVVSCKSLPSSLPPRKIIYVSERERNRHRLP